MKHLSSEQVLNFLPVPEWGHLEVEQVSPLIQRVWFYHDRAYVYRDDDTPVRTVWGFIKSGKVHTPKNYKTPNPKSVCDVVDAWRLPCYTSIVPTTTSLLHLG